MMTITYLKGDATRPVGDGLKLIPHIVNDAHKWGAGFVLAVSKRWPVAEGGYHAWFNGTLPDNNHGVAPVLGNILSVYVAPNIHVVHMVAQSGIRSNGGIPPIRYSALVTCLEKVMDLALLFEKERKVPLPSVHLPRIGCGLAGGTWDRIEPLLQKAFAGLEVFVYDLK